MQWTVDGYIQHQLCGGVSLRRQPRPLSGDCRREQQPVTEDTRGQSWSSAPQGHRAVLGGAEGVLPRRVYGKTSLDQPWAVVVHLLVVNYGLVFDISPEEWRSGNQNFYEIVNCFWWCYSIDVLDLFSFNEPKISIFQLNHINSNSWYQ